MPRFDRPRHLRCHPAFVVAAGPAGLWDTNEMPGSCVNGPDHRSVALQVATAKSIRSCSQCCSMTTRKLLLHNASTLSLSLGKHWMSEDARWHRGLSGSCRWCLSHGLSRTWHLWLQPQPHTADRLTVVWVDSWCFLSFVFLGSARRLEL